MDRGAAGTESSPLAARSATACAPATPTPVHRMARRRSTKHTAFRSTAMTKSCGTAGRRPFRRPAHRRSARLGRLLPGLHRFRRPAGRRDVSSVCRRSAGLRYAGRIQLRAPIPTARRRRRRGSLLRARSYVAQSVAGLSKRRPLARQQRGRHDRRRRSAGAQRSDDRRPRAGAAATASARTVAHLATRSTPSSPIARARRNLCWPMISGRSRNRARKRRRSARARRYYIYAAATDYPAYEASYPQNLSQFPLIKAANGQADVSTSDSFFGGIHERPARSCARLALTIATIVAISLTFGMRRHAEHAERPGTSVLPGIPDRRRRGSVNVNVTVTVPISDSGLRPDYLSSQHPVALDSARFGRRQRRYAASTRR